MNMSRDSTSLRNLAATA